MKKFHLSHNIYGAFFVLVIMGLTAITYFTTSINQETHTVQSQAAGSCGGNCDNKSAWISDCLKYNGSDKSSQCNDWFNAECSGCGSNGGNPNPTSPPPQTPNTGSACSDKSKWISDCLKYNGSDKSSQCNDWFNAECPPTPIPANTTQPTVPAGTGGAGSCNNGQIPNGYWACFSRTQVIQCVNGTYQNSTACTSCTGISASKSSICQGSSPGSQCASPEIWCASLSKCTGRTACPTPPPNTTDGRCTYIGDVDCITLTPAPGQCASPEVWCSTLNKCAGRTACPTPTPTPASQVFLPIVQNNQPTPIPTRPPANECSSPDVLCPTTGGCMPVGACPTPTGVQSPYADACGQPGASCCGTAFGQSACVTNGYECIAGKCRVGYAGFDDSSVTQVQTKLLECTTGSSGVQCTKPEVITVDQELIFNGCVALPNNQGFMCAN